MCYFSSIFPRMETFTGGIKRIHLVHSIFFFNRYDEQSGLYCPKSSTDVTECLGFKESTPVQMSRQTEQYLQRYYSRHNQNLLRMNQKIEFPLPKWIYG